MKPLISNIENEETAIQAFNAALTHEQADVVILGDVSGSMGQFVTSVGKSRLDVMRNSLLRVVSKMEKAAVALFASKAQRLASWNEFKPLSQGMLGGGTDLGAALRAAAKLNPSQIVVISDGEPNRPEQALAIARSMLCRIDVFYCGDGGSREVQFCRELAQYGGGAVIDPECVTMLESVRLFLTDAVIEA